MCKTRPSRSVVRGSRLYYPLSVATEHVAPDAAALTAASVSDAAAAAGSAPAPAPADEGASSNPATEGATEAERPTFFCVLLITLKC